MNAIACGVVSLPDSNRIEHMCIVWEIAAIVYRSGKENNGPSGGRVVCLYMRRMTGHAYSHTQFYIFVITLYFIRFWIELHVCVCTFAVSKTTHCMILLLLFSATRLSFHLSISSSIYRLSMRLCFQCCCSFKITESTN